MMPPNFIVKCSMVHCRRFAPTLFSRGENNRADTIRPYADGATELPMQKFRCANEGLKDTRHYLLYNPFIPSFRRISGWTCKLTGINHAERMNNTMFFPSKEEDRHD